MRTVERILGTRLWYRYALLKSGAGCQRGFIDRFERFASSRSGYGLDPRRVCDWAVGRQPVSKGMVQRVESEVPGTKDVFAIASLLMPKALSAPAVERVVRHLYVIEPDGGRYWMLPSIGASGASDDRTTPCVWEDAASLVLRGDFSGLLAILALLRMSVARSELEQIGHYAQHLYAVLPSVSRFSWVRPDVDLLLQCVEDMMVGIRWLFARVMVDWEAFRAQIREPKPWEGRPPWIFDESSLSAKALPRYLPRPLPLLEGVVPLRPWVHPSRSESVPRSAIRPASIERCGP